MPTGQDLVKLFLSQEGDEYEWGIKPDPADPDPDEGDCSGYVHWVVVRAGGDKKFPLGSWLQFEYCQAQGLEISVEDAIKTPGALLFRLGVKGMGNHVVVSQGNGKTIEAMGEAWGVVEGRITPGRKFNRAALAPGVKYEGWEV